MSFYKNWFYIVRVNNVNNILYTHLRGIKTAIATVKTSKEFTVRLTLNNYGLLSIYFPSIRRVEKYEYISNEREFKS